MLYCSQPSVLDFVHITKCVVKWCIGTSA